MRSFVVVFMMMLLGVGECAVDLCAEGQTPLTQVPCGRPTPGGIKAVGPSPTSKRLILTNRSARAETTGEGNKAPSPYPLPRGEGHPTTGVPLGGIGAGCIRVMPDGSITGATINNNWHHPVENMPGCFGAVMVRSGKQSTARVIALQSRYGLPVLPAIDFDGAFPEASLHCPEASFADADITLRAFSPFVPGDIRSSEFPAAAFVFHLVNRSASPITVAVALSWENTLGIGETPEGTPFENRTGNHVTSIPDSEGFFGIKFTRPVAAGGSAAAVDPKYDSADGDMTLMAHPFRNSAVVTTAGWNALDAKPGWWDSFARDGVVSGDAQAGVQGSSHPAGVLAVQVVIKPRESIDIPMCISWNTPVLRSASGDDYGHFYSVSFGDSTAAARALLGDWQLLLSLTDEWQKRILKSTLPVDESRRIVNSASALVSSSIHVRDGRFTLLPGIGGSAAAASKPEETVETYLQQRRRAAGMLVTLFPQLNAQELVELLLLRGTEGYYSSLTSDWGARIGPAKPLPDPAETTDGNPIDLPNTPPPAAEKAPVVKSDAAELESLCAFVLQARYTVASTNNLVFLRHTILGMRSAMQVFLARLDSSGRPVPSGVAAASQTDDALYDWMNALRAARYLADIASAHAFEWAPTSGPLGTAPGALIEIAAERGFAERCDAAAVKIAAYLNQSKPNSNRTLLSPMEPYSHPSRLDDVALCEQWNILRAFEGFGIDMQTGDVYLTTPIPGTWRSLTAPVFAPTFVGRLEYKPSAHGGSLTLRIDRTVSLNPVRSFRHRAGATGSAQLVIRKLHVAGPPPTNPATPQAALADSIDVHVSLGSNPIGCKVVREPAGTLQLTFDSPLTLLTGDVLQVVVH